MLMVTTTVGVLNRVHGNTSDLGPAVTLDLVLVVVVTGLQNGLISSATTSDDTNSGAGVRLNDLLGTRWESECQTVSPSILLSFDDFLIVIYV
jgi:hypothetical protein